MSRYKWYKVEPELSTGTELVLAVVFYWQYKLLLISTPIEPVTSDAANIFATIVFLVITSIQGTRNTPYY